MMNFTSAFDIVTVDVLQHDESHAVLPIEFTNALRESYENSVPLVLKFEDLYFTAKGESSIPYNTLVVPNSWNFDCRVDLKVLKGDFAELFFNQYV